jgi:hypothetical protein
MKFILFLLLSSVPAFAQMPDVLSGLAIQGMLTDQSVKSVKQGLSAVNKNKILQDIQMVVMDIKTRYFGNYQNVNKNSISFSAFQGMNYNIGNYNNSKFFIELLNIDNNLCHSLMNISVMAIETQINGNNDKNSCVSNNNIKFIFD